MDLIRTTKEKENVAEKQAQGLMVYCCLSYSNAFLLPCMPYSRFSALAQSLNKVHLFFDC